MLHVESHWRHARVVTSQYNCGYITPPAPSSPLHSVFTFYISSKIHFPQNLFFSNLSTFHDLNMNMTFHTLEILFCIVLFFFFLSVHFLCIFSFVDKDIISIWRTTNSNIRVTQSVPILYRKFSMAPFTTCSLNEKLKAEERCVNVWCSHLPTSKKIENLKLSKHFRRASFSHQL